MRSRPMRRVGVLLAASCACPWIVAGPAAAEPGQGSPTTAPVEVTDDITDHADALGMGRDAVQDAIDRLDAETDYRLFVVYVESFDGAEASRWASATATDAGLGDEDLLLAVAVRDRHYALSVGEGIDLGADQLARVESATEERLVEDEWAAAAIVAADTTRLIVTGGDAPATGASVGARWIVVGVGAAVVGGLVAVLTVRRLRAEATPPGPGTDEGDHPSSATEGP